MSAASIFNWHFNELAQAWSVYEQAGHTGDFAVLRQWYATDDGFGNLVETDETVRRVSRAGFGPESDSEEEALDRWLGYTPPTDDRPAVLAATVDPCEHGFCGKPITNIVISEDGHWGITPLYRIDVQRSGDGPLIVTQGQLAALLVAAQQLLKPVPKARGRLLS